MFPSFLVGPVPWQQLFDPVDRMAVGDAGKDVGEPGLWVDVLMPRAPRDLPESVYDPLTRKATDEF